MLPRCSLDALVRRQAEAIQAEALRYCLAETRARQFVMNRGIPVKVGMEKRPQVVSFLLLFLQASILTRSSANSVGF